MTSDDNAPGSDPTDEATPFAQDGSRSAPVSTDQPEPETEPANGEVPEEMANPT